MFPPHIFRLVPLPLRAAGRACWLALLVYDMCNPAACKTPLQHRQPLWATLPVCGRGTPQPDRAPQSAAVVLQ